MIDIGQSSTKWWWVISDAKFGLNAEWTCCWLRDQFLGINRFRILAWRRCRVTMFRDMWIWPFNLDEAFRTDCLIATSCFVKIWRIVEEADWTFRSVLVKICFNGLTIDVRVLGELHLSWRDISLWGFSRSSKRCKSLCSTPEKCRSR